MKWAGRADEGSKSGVSSQAAGARLALEGAESAEDEDLRSVDELRRALKSEDGAARRKAAETLKDRAEIDADSVKIAIPELSDVLGDPYDFVREAAAYALGQLGADGRILNIHMKNIGH